MDRRLVNGQRDEWTVVPHAKRRGTKPVPQAPGADKDITLEKLIANYKHRMQIWRASTSRQTLLQILDRKQPENGWQIKQALFFASGSFCRDNWECQRRSMTQFVAFMDIVEHLQVSNDQDIAVFAQEPAYTPLDVEFLCQMNITTPPASEPGQSTDGRQFTKYHLDSDCFVFEAFMDKILPAIRPLVRSDARLFIGTPSPTSGANRLSPEEFEEMRSLYDQFDTNHSCYYFPTFDEDPNVFEGLRISWANESGDD